MQIIDITIDVIISGRLMIDELIIEYLYIELVPAQFASQF